MEIQITAEEVFTEYKQQLSELYHELLLEKLKNRKLIERIRELEAKAPAIPSVPFRDLRAPQETLPVAPPPPVPPTWQEDSLGGERGKTV